MSDPSRRRDAYPQRTMKTARPHDDVALEALLAEASGDGARRPALAVIRALIDARTEPPPAAVERRHLAAIGEAVRELGDRDEGPRPRRRGRPALVPRLWHLRPAKVSLKVAALALAGMLALTGIVFAATGLPAPIRAALEEVGVLEEDGARPAEISEREPSQRGPKSRCVGGGRDRATGCPSSQPSGGTGAAERRDRAGPRARPATSRRTGGSATREGDRGTGNDPSAVPRRQVSRPGRSPASPPGADSSPPRRQDGRAGGGRGAGAGRSKGARGQGRPAAKPGRDSRTPRGSTRGRGRGAFLTGRGRVGAGARRASVPSRSVRGGPSTP